MGKFFIILGAVLIVIGLIRIAIALCTGKENSHTEETNDEQQ